MSPKSKRTFPIRAGNSLFKFNCNYRISIFITLIVLLLPAPGTAREANKSSLEILIQIGTDYGYEKAQLLRQPSMLDNSIKILSYGIKKRPARYMRRVQVTESHIIIEGLDKHNQVIYKDSLIDPRFVRAEWINKIKQFEKVDLYRSSSQLHVVLPNDLRITKLQLSLPRWNGREFDFESIALVQLRKGK